MPDALDIIAALADWVTSDGVPRPNPSEVKYRPTEAAWADFIAQNPSCAGKPRPQPSYIVRTHPTGSIQLQWPLWNWTEDQLEPEGTS